MNVASNENDGSEAPPVIVGKTNGDTISQSASPPSIEQRLAALESKLSTTSSRSDRVICKTALASNGLDWERSPDFEDDVDEALRRALSVDKCRVVLGLPSLPTSTE